MSDAPKILLLDKRQTGADVADDNPFDTSPKTETEAHIELGAQRLANEKVRHLQRTRKSITFRQLAASRDTRPHLEMEMPPIEGQNLGLFYFTVCGEHQAAEGGWRKYERFLVEGAMIEISAPNRKAAEGMADEGIMASAEHARRAFFAEEIGALDELVPANEGLIVGHDFRKRGH